MNVRIFIGFALVAAASAAAACGGESSPSLRRDDGIEDGQPVGGAGADAGARPEAGTTTTPEPGKLPTGSKAGETFFAASVFPLLKAQCGGCHAAGGSGNPTWIDGADAKKTYDMLYLQAYVSAASRIVVKGEHVNGAALALSADGKAKWAEWIAIESKEPGKPTQKNVLEKFGDCFDKAKFDAIGLGQLRVTRRRANNNPQGLQEDAEECTGCRDNTACFTCHSADDSSGFIMAIGNPIFEPRHTFDETKKLSPAFIRQYVGTTPAGEPTFNPGVKTKSTHTIEKAKAYSHPMYRVTPEMDAAMKAFVDAAIEKHRAGQCGK